MPAVSSLRRKQVRIPMRITYYGCGGACRGSRRCRRGGACPLGWRCGIAPAAQPTLVAQSVFLRSTNTFHESCKWLASAACSGRTCRIQIALCWGAACNLAQTQAHPRHQWRGAWRRGNLAHRLEALVSVQAAVKSRAASCLKPGDIRHGIHRLLVHQLSLLLLELILERFQPTNCRCEQRWPQCVLALTKLSDRKVRKQRCVQLMCVVCAGARQVDTCSQVSHAVLSICALCDEETADVPERHDPLIWRQLTSKGSAASLPSCASMLQFICTRGSPNACLPVC